MASASMKALDQPTVEVVTGSYRVASTLIKVQTKSREELHNLTTIVREFVRSAGIRAGAVIVSSLHQ
jgi:hypothetical protein